MGFPNFPLLPPKLSIIGHRGVAALAPENTMVGFKLAKALGVEWIEFDLRLTKDKKLVIFHDETLERTTNGQGWVHEHEVQKLTSLDAGSWFSPLFQDEKIPILTEQLPELLALNCTLNFELKIPVAAPHPYIDDFLAAVLDILENAWPKERPLPLLSSFYWPILLHLKERLPALPIGFLHQNCTPMMVEQVAELTFAALHIYYRSITPEMLQLTRQAGLPVLAYTVNDPAIAQQLLLDGVFALFSDNPPLLAAKVNT